MKYRIANLSEREYKDGDIKNTVIYFNDLKKWAYSNIQYNNYEYFKSTNSADLRDKVKYIRMEERFYKQYVNLDITNNMKILVHYES